MGSTHHGEGCKLLGSEREFALTADEHGGRSAREREGGRGGKREGERYGEKAGFGKALRQRKLSRRRGRSALLLLGACEK